MPRTLRPHGGSRPSGYRPGLSQRIGRAVGKTNPDILISQARNARQASCQFQQALPVSIAQSRWLCQLASQFRQAAPDASLRRRRLASNFLRDEHVPRLHSHRVVSSLAARPAPAETGPTATRFFIVLLKDFRNPTALLPDLPDRRGPSRPACDPRPRKASRRNWPVRSRPACSTHPSARSRRARTSPQG